MNERMGKILVIRGGAIGDFILTLPVLAALREHFPEAQLAILGYPHIVPLALAGGLADQTLSIEARALAGFFARSGDLDEKLAARFATFNLIVSYLYDPDEIFRSNVARCSKAQFIAGPHRPNETGDIHAAEVFLQPLQRLAIFEADTTPRLILKKVLPSWPAPVGDQGSEIGEGGSGNQTAGRIGAGANHRWLALHPGSGSESKNWPEEKWAELLRSLVKRTDLNFLLVGGEAEEDRLPRLAAGLPPERTQLAQNWPLVELAFRLQQCGVYVGHDSGISHLTAAVGLEGLILWPNTNGAVWGPRSGRMKILRSADGLAGLPVGRVLEELETLVKNG